MPGSIGQKFIVVLLRIVLRVEEVFYIPKHYPEGVLGFCVKRKTDAEDKQCHSKHKRSVILSIAKDLKTPTCAFQILHCVQNDTTLIHLSFKLLLRNIYQHIEQVLPELVDCRDVHAFVW